MNLAVKLTFGALTQALRGLAHDLAARAEERRERRNGKTEADHERGA